MKYFIFECEVIYKESYQTYYDHKLTVYHNGELYFLVLNKDKSNHFICGLTFFKCEDLLFIQHFDVKLHLTAYVT